MKKNIQFIVLLIILLSFSFKLISDTSGFVPGGVNPPYSDTSDPQICCDSASSIIAVWVQSNAIYGQRCVDGVWDVNGAKLISSGIYDAKNPKICCDTVGHAIVIWEELSHLFVAGFTPGSGISGIQTLSTTGYAPGTAQICCDTAGHAITAWLSSDQTTITLVGYSSVHGTLDLPPGTINPDTGYALVSFQICCDTADHAIIAWIEYSSSLVFTKLNGARFTSSTGNLTTPDLINVTGYPITSMALCCDQSNHAFITWIENQIIYKIIGAGYTPGGGTPISNLIDSGLTLINPAICCCATNLCAIG